MQDLIAITDLKKKKYSTLSSVRMKFKGAWGDFENSIKLKRENKRKFKVG